MDLEMKLSLLPRYKMTAAGSVAIETEKSEQN